MMRVQGLRLLVPTLLLVAACTYPTGEVQRQEDRPSLAIVGAPATATLIVDGINHGAANQFDGNPRILLLEEGTHRVRVVSGGTDLLEQEVLLASGETRTLTISRGGVP